MKNIDLSSSIFVVDENVWKHHCNECLRDLQGQEIIILPISEEKKRLDSVLNLYDQLMERAAKRNMTIVSIGGGITQDITGFMASTLYRGINWVFVPTTLLAQADSCIGSKTSLNYKHYKNLIGTFYPPSSVYIFAPFLTTQLEFDYFSGVGEVIKLHLMGGEEKANRLIDGLDKIISRDPVTLLSAVKESLFIKKNFIEEDEFDFGRRNMLNYGHCFGHALESATDFLMPHGQAVTLGMILANIVANKRGLLARSVEEYLAKRALWPAVRLPEEALTFDKDKVIQAMKQDKKRTGKDLALVMLADNYQLLKVNDLVEKEAFNALEKLEQGYREHRER